MSVNEIKDLAKYLSEEEVEKIKKEIKDKENTLKGGSLDEEEMIQVLNTLFAVLVIEKALESEIEEIEAIRDELEAELLECYEVYDTYMAKFRKQDKKKKKKWLLGFLGLSEDIAKRKSDIASSDKALNNIKKELNALKQQKSDDHLKEVVSNRESGSVEKYCDCLKAHRHPRGHCPSSILDRIEGRGIHGPHHHRHHEGQVHRQERQDNRQNEISQRQTERNRKPSAGESRVSRRGTELGTFNR